MRINIQKESHNGMNFRVTHKKSFGDNSIYEKFFDETQLSDKGPIL
ncbi:MAG TPA: hypothetical protein VER14_08275 [Phototrophicaceae bacterium]|nr:hypothetical protein [Phototrophicaceae bacterium]